MIGACDCDAGICCDCRSADHIRRRGNVHLYTAREVVAQRVVGCVPLRRWALASHQYCLSLLQGSIHKPWSRA